MLKLLPLLLILSCSQISPIQKKPETAATPISFSKEIKHKKVSNSVEIQSFCQKIDKQFKRYNWKSSKCDQVQWQSVRKSHFGNPIMWTVFEDSEVKNTTVLLCGVHPDEITPVKFCFDIINDLTQNPIKYKSSRVIVAPLVTTDPFFFKKPTRTNSRKVDVNRNFPTGDWKEHAHRLWNTKYHKNKRRYPGEKALSEQETIFQVNLIKLYKPDYVVSVHAPLQLLDYDGPSLKSKDSKETKDLLHQMSSKAGNYKIANYPFYPGSLGNWAGNERELPTFTLELPNSDWNKTKKYFRTFSPAVYHVFTFKNK